MAALPALKLRVKANFPTRVEGAGGIGVSKTNGVWIIEPRFDELDEITAPAVTSPTSKQIWIYDPVEDTVNVLTLAGLGDALYTATSTSSLAIGTGSKTFITQAGKDFGVGSFVLATSDADVADYMSGQVTSYSGTSLVLSVIATGGAGTNADWTLRAAGVGANGPAGAGDVDGPASATDNSLARFDGTTGKLLKDGAVIGTDVLAFDAQLSSLVRQNSQSAAYTAVLTDGGKHILHPVADNNARTFTIPANASVAYPVGTVLSFVNEINTVTIAITTDTLTLAGLGTTGSRSLAANGMATALKLTSTKWLISGTGLS